MRMGYIVWPFLWFAFLAAAIAYGSYLFLGNIVHTRESGALGSVMIRDELQPGVHNLFGMVSVPTPCDELIVHTEALSTSTFMLSFRTWREPAIKDCPKEETPRSFHAVVFGPAAGIEFVASLNGAGLPIVVLPYASKSGSSRP
ncbi:MAG: hypothetical protein RLZZ416_458 [Candidatus Parcubacteria bacterium]|jgi:hypothetical protein